MVRPRSRRRELASALTLAQLACLLPSHAFCQAPAPSSLPPEPPAFSLVRVDACTFEMGLSDAEAQLLRERGVWDDWFANEQPRHRVTLTRPFEIGRFEVTQEEWRRAMGSEPWAGQDHVLEDPACPAVGVSWLDCQAFLARLGQEGGTARYRLPTEAEWECASRGGSGSQIGRAHV